MIIAIGVEVEKIMVDLMIPPFHTMHIRYDR
jgi:hypothetical protein